MWSLPPLPIYDKMLLCKKITKTNLLHEQVLKVCLLKFINLETSVTEPFNDLTFWYWSSYKPKYKMLALHLKSSCALIGSLCRSGRDPEKYFDIGMVRDNQLGIMGSETFWQNISFKTNAYLQTSCNRFTITYFVHWRI